MCFRSAAEGQKAFRRRAASSFSRYSEAKKPEWQRNQGQLESQRGAWWGGRVLDQDLNLNGRSGPGWQSSGTVSHNNKGGQELTKLSSRDRPWLGLAVPLPAPSQLGVGRRIEAHRRARSSNHKRGILLLLFLHAILFSQLPIDSHGLVSKECQIPCIAGSDRQETKLVKRSANEM